MENPTSLNPQEIPFYDAHKDDWWAEKGPFQELHRMNPARIAYTKACLERENLGVNGGKKPLEGLRGLDIGCGGGIATEPLARLGAMMTGLDTSGEACQAAKAHAQKQNLEIQYHQGTIEKFAKDVTSPFDFVVAFEVLEHVSDLSLFCQGVSEVLKPNGVFVFSTLNRTSTSYLGAKILGEYLFRLLPVGTHNWSQFLKPSEVRNSLKSSGITLKSIEGFRPNPLTKKWYTGGSNAINYLGYGVKE